jgi:uncharacterized protein with PQ loop repeat
MVQNKGLQHLHLRKRIHQKNEAYPSENKLKRFYDKLIFGLAILCPFLNLPQLLKILVEKSAEGVSAISWFSFSAISTMWFIYGFIHREKPIIIVNGGLIIIQFAIGMGAVIY